MKILLVGSISAVTKKWGWLPFDKSLHSLLAAATTLALLRCALRSMRRSTSNADTFIRNAGLADLARRFDASRRRNLTATTTAHARTIKHLTVCRLTTLVDKESAERCWCFPLRKPLLSLLVLKERLHEGGACI